MPRNLQELLDVMKDMVVLEKALAQLYKTCSEHFDEDKKFWLAICHQEERHAQFIEELATLVSSHPEEFKFGRSFNSTAITTIVSNVRNSEKQICDGQIDRRKALLIARDIENSVLETKYHEIVSTDNIKFTEAIDRITRDTLTHKNLFAAKNSQLSS